MLDFIISLMNNASVVLAIVAFLGLVLLKKSASEVIQGTLKTILGFLILSAGSTVICTALSEFSSVFTEAFGLSGFVAEDNAIAAAVQTVLGMETSFIMVFAFIINLVIARFTKWKYVFLTGHMMFSFAATMAIVLDLCGINGWAAVAIGALVQGVCQVLFPALAQPHVRKLTGNDAVGFGFWGSSLCWAAGLVGGLVGNKEKSAEDIKVPEKLGFLKDMSILMSIVMIIVYIVTYVWAGPEVVSHYTTDNLVVGAVFTALEFVAGVLVLLQGVRMFLGELIPAFKGISEKLVPGAIPALDIPFLYSFAPVSTTVGFVFAMIGGIVATLISTSMSAVILPSVIGLFFMGGAAGVFGNLYGGTRGACVAGFFLGFVFSMMPVLFFNFIDLSVYGISGLWFASTDAIIIAVIIRALGLLF